jgi:hypothetical protein
MDWQQLKKEIYYCDESLRDIYVHNTTKDDWQIWADFVNENYKTVFHIHETEVKSGKVNLQRVFDFWAKKHDICSTAKTYIDTIKLILIFLQIKKLRVI